ncbi:trypco2 family protein [Streptomyces sp. NPDC058316]|uniref:trypco2 family protein n=1 Tax=unclassified Streptomyces TaxID=2593676 RepID=UPI00332745DA
MYERGRTVTGSTHGDDWLDLADALDLLRSQVAESQRRARRSEVRFGVEQITVDFELELTRTREGGGGLRFGIADARARQESGRRSVQRVSLTLKPERPGGGDVQIGDWE